MKKKYKKYKLKYKLNKRGGSHNIEFIHIPYLPDNLQYKEKPKYYDNPSPRYNWSLSYKWRKPEKPWWKANAEREIECRKYLRENNQKETKCQFHSLNDIYERDMSKYSLESNEILDITDCRHLFGRCIYPRYIPCCDRWMDGRKHAFCENKFLYGDHIMYKDDGSPNPFELFGFVEDHNISIWIDSELRTKRIENNKKRKEDLEKKRIAYHKKLEEEIIKMPLHKRAGYKVSKLFQKKKNIEIESKIPFIPRKDEEIYWPYQGLFDEDLDEIRCSQGEEAYRNKVIERNKMVAKLFEEGFDINR